MGRNYDEIIHDCNKILKNNPEDEKMLLRLGEAYMLKADTEGESVFYRLSIETYRKILSKNPGSEDAHSRILKVASKAQMLDGLAMEYNEKIKKLSSGETRENKLIDIYQKMLSRIYVLALFDKDIRIAPYAYNPGFLVRIAFDFILFPVSAILLLLSIFDKRFHPALLNSIVLMLFYLAYRLLIISMKR